MAVTMSPAAIAGLSPYSESLREHFGYAAPLAGISHVVEHAKAGGAVVYAGFGAAPVACAGVAHVEFAGGAR